MQPPGVALETPWPWKKSSTNCYLFSEVDGGWVCSLGFSRPCADAQHQNFILSEGQELPHPPATSHTLPPEVGTPNLSWFPSTPKAGTLGHAKPFHGTDEAPDMG